MSSLFAALSVSSVLQDSLEVVQSRVGVGDFDMNRGQFPLFIHFRVFSAPYSDMQSCCCHQICGERP